MKFLKTEKKTNEKKDYFAHAKSWSDDVFASVEQSKNRYQLAFFSSMALNVLAVFAVGVLAPMQTLVPIMVHHYDNGIVTVEPLKNENMPMDRAQIESDIVRYIQNRESYDISSYKTQYDLVNILSNDDVAAQYAREQDKSSHVSPIKFLGAHSYREAHVFSINFLDNLNFNEKEVVKNHHNLAEVVFSLTDIDKSTGKKQETHYNAIISWDYVKPSLAPDIRWKNFDGFMVTRYNKQLRNV